MKINIITNNLHEFDELAYILDYDNIRNAINDLRLQWRIPNELIPYTEFHKWLSENKNNLGLTPEVRNQLDWISDQLDIRSIHKILSENDIWNKEMELERIYDCPYKFQIEFILRKNGINAQWREIMLKAIVCGEVINKDYQEAKELSNEYEFKIWLYEDIRLELPRIYKKKKKPKTKIKRDREWRFSWVDYKKENPNMLGIPGKVLDAWNNLCTNTKDHDNGKCKHCIYVTNIVEQAISRYNKFLQS